MVENSREQQPQQHVTVPIPLEAVVHPPKAWLEDLTALPDERLDHVLEHLASCLVCRAAAHGLDATELHDADSEARESLVGKNLGEYQVLARLDDGAMGVVYRGLHPVIGKPIAIKVMRRDYARDPDHAHRLVAEARAVNAINHPNIVDVYSYGTLPDGRPYLVMELLSGQNLRVLGRDQRLSIADALDVLVQVSGAIAAAHSAGVVHRDLKPSNIFLDRRYGRLHATVLDFGVAKVARTLSPVTTTPGMMIGTLGYMAPEQILALQITPAADIYALGCLAWWLLTGTELFTAKNDEELLRRHIEETPVSIANLTRVAPALATLVASMLEKSPRSRPTAAEVHQLFTLQQTNLRRESEAQTMLPTPAQAAVVVAPAVQPPPRRRPSSSASERAKLTMMAPVTIPERLPTPAPIPLHQRAKLPSKPKLAPVPVPAKPPPPRFRPWRWVLGTLGFLTSFGLYLLWEALH